MVCGITFAFGAERAAGLVYIGVCSWSDSGSVECRGGCLGVKLLVWERMTGVSGWCGIAVSVAERWPDQS